MQDSHDPLSQLWHQQEVDEIDLTEIKREYKKQKFKQILYFAIDSLSMLPVVYFLTFGRDVFSSAAYLGFIGISLIAVGYFVYITWLRRHAVFGRSEKTLSFTNSLRKQFKNNQRIANLTKHSCWVTMLALAAFYGTLRWLGEIPDEKWGFVLNVLAGTAVVMFGAAVWAHKREAMFKNKSQWLDDITNSEGN